MAMVARRAVVSVRVQGVGFRWFARETAEREGVHGWVRNLPDGRVEVLVEGEGEAVTRIERLLWQGPGGARVTSVAVDDSEPPSGAHHGFAIRP